MPRRLTQRQKCFCTRYVLENVAAVAARQAGYARWTARNAANHFLKNPLIAAEIERLRAERKSVLPVMTQSALANEVRKMAAKLSKLAREIQSAEVTAEG